MVDIVSYERRKKVQNLLINWDIDITERLPKGTIPRLMQELPACKRHDINNSITIVREWALAKKAANKLNSPPAEPTIKDKVYNVITSFAGQRLPKGTITKFAKYHGLDKYHAEYLFKSIRKKNGIIIKPQKELLKKEKQNDLVAMVRTLNVIRKLPNQNRYASTTIIRGLQDNMPKGGAGLFIGTPTPFAVSDNMRNNCLLTDELEVAIALNMTTDPSIKPTIIIGDLITPERAHIKGQMWLNNNSTNDWPIIVAPVDRNAYTRYIVRLVERYSLTKVVLMTSGIWECCPRTQEKYQQDFNFKSPSEYLTSVYPNLHILAMIMVNGNQFKILHLHNGKVETL